MYVCPIRHDLPTTGHVVPGGLRQYRAKPTSCGPCVLKPRCTTGLARMVTRNVHEDEREHVRRLAGTPAFKRSARERRKVAHLKRSLGLRRLRLRGPTGDARLRWDIGFLCCHAPNAEEVSKEADARPSRDLDTGRVRMPHPLIWGTKTVDARPAFV